MALGAISSTSYFVGRQKALISGINSKNLHPILAAWSHMVSLITFWFRQKPVPDFHDCWQPSKYTGILRVTAWLHFTYY